MILRKREIFSRLAALTGITRALEVAARRPCIFIVNYHRVTNPETCPFDRAVIEATPEVFDQQMALLKRRYNVIGLDEVQSIVHGQTPLRHFHVMVTFDDGYRDTHDVALPILKSHGLPAAFFLTTGFIETNKVPWWDQLAFVVRTSTQRRIRLTYPRDIELNVDELGTEGTIHAVLRAYKHPDTKDVARFLSEVATACDVRLPDQSAERLFLSWAEARALAAAGMGIGSHTHTHELLAKLTREQQQDECLRSRDLLREHLGVAVDALAFPVGGRTAFSHVTKQCLRDTGYRTAFSYGGGVNRPGMDPLDLKRTTVDRMSLEQYRFRTAVAGAAAMQVW
jgi:peptidoglycan/xylan/chitin deacetylase (PgdA/CDA1 family)